jgi:hypothetical protein
MKNLDNKIKIAISNSSSMNEASKKLGMHFNTFKRHAKRLNLYKPIKKEILYTKEEILEVYNNNSIKETCDILNI